MHIVNDGLWFGLVLFFLLCFNFLFLACAHLSGCMYRCQGKKHSEIEITSVKWRIRQIALSMIGPSLGKLLALTGRWLNEKSWERGEDARPLQEAQETEGSGTSKRHPESCLICRERSRGCRRGACFSSQRGWWQGWMTLPKACKKG